MHSLVSGQNCLIFQVWWLPQPLSIGLGDPLYISGGKPDTSFLAVLEASQQTEINQDDG